MLLHLDKINYKSLIRLSTQLHTCSSISEIYSALLHSVMGKLISPRALLAYTNSSNETSVLYAVGKNPFSFNNILEPIYTVNPTILQDFYQTTFTFNRTDESQYTIYIAFYNNESRELSDDENQYLELVTQIASSAISNFLNLRKIEDLAQETQLSNLFLKSLVEVNQALISVTSIDGILSTFYNTMRGQLGITKVAFFVVDDDNGFLEHINLFGIQFPEEMLCRFYEFDKSSNKNDLGLSCELCNFIEYYIPIHYNGRKHGFILLGKKLNNASFSEEQDIMFASGLASATMGAIIKEHLVEQLIEKKNIERELEIALEIQNNLMPKSSPIIPGYSISADSIPSRQVGGDYYDIIKIKDDKYLFIIADVSGKGIPAALLMANVQAACRVLPTHATDLNELLNSVNMLVFQNTPAERFVTMFVCVLDTNSQTLTYSNAGHNPPLYITSNHEVKRLTEGGIILGLFDIPIDYQCGTIQLDNDSIVCLYTDGIVECPLSPDRELDEEKLANYIKTHFTDTPREIMEGIYSHISNTTGNKINYDDQTIIIIKKT